MINLGALYANGQGVAQDYAKARELYEKAADKGDENAMTNLGLLYANSQGVAQDYAKARELYERAADQSDELANTMLKRLAISVAAADGRYAEALQLSEALAAEQEAVETERKGKPGTDTANSLDGVVWFALMAGEYGKALTVADRALRILPDSLEI
jgi:TPR repeat protein